MRELRVALCALVTCLATTSACEDHVTDAFSGQSIAWARPAAIGQTCTLRITSTCEACRLSVVIEDMPGSSADNCIAEDIAMWERSGGGGGRDVMTARGCFNRFSEVSFGHSVTLVWTRRRAAQGAASIAVKVTQQAWAGWRGVVFVDTRFSVLPRDGVIPYSVHLASPRDSLELWLYPTSVYSAANRVVIDVRHNLTAGSHHFEVPYTHHSMRAMMQQATQGSAWRADSAAFQLKVVIAQVSEFTSPTSTAFFLPDALNPTSPRDGVLVRTTADLTLTNRAPTDRDVQPVLYLYTYLVATSSSLRTDGAEVPALTLAGDRPLRLFRPATIALGRAPVEYRGAFDVFVTTYPVLHAGELNATLAVASARGVMLTVDAPGSSACVRQLALPAPRHYVVADDATASDDHGLRTTVELLEWGVETLELRPEFSGSGAACHAVVVAPPGRQPRVTVRISDFAGCRTSKANLLFYAGSSPSSLLRALDTRDYAEPGAVATVASTTSFLRITLECGEFTSSGAVALDTALQRRGPGLRVGRLRVGMLPLDEALTLTWDRPEGCSPCAGSLRVAVAAPGPSEEPSLVLASWTSAETDHFVWRAPAQSLRALAGPDEAPPLFVLSVTIDSVVVERSAPFRAPGAAYRFDIIQDSVLTLGAPVVISPVVVAPLHVPQWLRFRVAAPPRSFPDSSSAYALLSEYARSPFAVNDSAAPPLAMAYTPTSAGSQFSASLEGLLGGRLHTFAVSRTFFIASAMDPEQRCSGVKYVAVPRMLQLLDPAFGRGYLSPGVYDNLMSCTWVLMARPGQSLAVAFTEFDVESSQGCTHDHLRTFAGAGGQAVELGRYCGAALPPRGMLGNFMRVEWTTDSTTTAGGFRMVYRAASDADGDMLATRPMDGSIDGVALDQVALPGAQLTLRLGVPAATRRRAVQLIVRLSCDAGSCFHPSARPLRSASTLWSAPVSGLAFENDTTTVAVNVPSRLRGVGVRLELLAVVWRSDAEQGSALLAVSPQFAIADAYDASAALHCANVDAGEPSPVFVALPRAGAGQPAPAVEITHGTAAQYANGQDCRWLLMAPPGHGVEVAFEAVALQPSYPSCAADHITVFEGAAISEAGKTNVTHAVRTCGSHAPAAFTAGGGAALVQFASDGSSTHAGFRLRVRARREGSALDLRLRSGDPGLIGAFEPSHGIDIVSASSGLTLSITTAAPPASNASSVLTVSLSATSAAKFLLPGRSDPFAVSAAARRLLSPAAPSALVLATAAVPALGYSVEIHVEPPAGLRGTGFDLTVHNGDAEVLAQKITLADEYVPGPSCGDPSDIEPTVRYIPLLPSGVPVEFGGGVLDSGSGEYEPGTRCRWVIMATEPYGIRANRGSLARWGFNQRTDRVRFVDGADISDTSPTIASYAAGTWSQARDFGRCDVPDVLATSRTSFMTVDFWSDGSLSSSNARTKRFNMRLLAVWVSGGGGGGGSNYGSDTGAAGALPWLLIIVVAGLAALGCYCKLRGRCKGASADGPAAEVGVRNPMHAPPQAMQAKLQPNQRSAAVPTTVASAKRPDGGFEMSFVYGGPPSVPSHGPAQPQSNPYPQPGAWSGASAPYPGGPGFAAHSGPPVGPPGYPMHAPHQSAGHPGYPAGSAAFPSGYAGAGGPGYPGGNPAYPAGPHQGYAGAGGPGYPVGLPGWGPVDGPSPPPPPPHHGSSSGPWGAAAAPYPVDGGSGGQPVRAPIGVNPLYASPTTGAEPAAGDAGDSRLV